MFYYLNGTVTVIEENLAVLDCGGVGFACHTTGYTLSQIKRGQTCRLYTYCSIKEDAFDIFGFATKEELGCFRRLIGVTGVGPKAALAILSSTTPDRFVLGVMTGDEKVLTAVPGVGKKLAQRIILELKDKLGGLSKELGGGAGGPVSLPGTGTGKLAEASAALASLGYSQSEIGLALRGIDVENSTLEEIVRLALRAMVQNRG